MLIGVLLWLGQAVLLGTFLSILEQGKHSRPFKLYWWAYAYGMFWPLIWVFRGVGILK